MGLAQTLVDTARDINLIRAAGLLVALPFFYFIGLCIYNIYFHPLRNIPGSKLAVIGPYLEFYHEVIRDGQYLWEIKKMHDKYGPVIRVNAREVHVRDPMYYANIYPLTAKRIDKDPATVGAFDVPHATAATVEHFHHRSRRGYLNPYFSKRAIVGLEPTIHNRISALLGRIDQHMKENKVLSLDGLFSALTADVITTRFYGRHYDYLSVPDFHFVVRDAFLGLTRVYHLARFFPSVVTTLKSLPYACIRMILPPVAELLIMREEIRANGVDEFTKSQTSDAKSSVLVGALADPSIPIHERKIDRLLDEGTVFLFAGTETTSKTLAITMFYLLSNPDVLAKLRAELEALPPAENNEYPLAKLENLPYLSGVVYEGFRLSFGPISRSARVSVQEDLHYKDLVIPAGTPVSQSTYFMHSDATLWPEPEKFDPERWVKAAKEGINMSKYITNFSKGNRQCIGYSMAFAEMFMTLSRVVRAYDLELFDTTLADIDITHARIVGYPKKIPGKTEGAGEVRVKILQKNY